jgi:3-deoxy-D-manno-octulosonic-acid transferase
MLLWVYRFLFVPALALLAPRYLWRMRRRGGYGSGFAQRLGASGWIPPRRPGVRRIWMQAVSVGELLAIGPLLDALARESGVEVILTCTTSTGRALAEQRYAQVTVARGYFPLDFWLISSRIWSAVAPDLVVLAEGERWPEFLAQARARGVKVVCINARMSDRSFRRLQTFRWAVPTLLRGITRLLAVSEEDAARFRSVGFASSSVYVTGNLKLDVAPVTLTTDEQQALRLQLGFSPRDPIVLGSSTWPGEEAALLAAFQHLRAKGLAAHLLLVPRHAERRDEVTRELLASGLTFHVRSRGAAPSRVEVTLADTTGELRRLTALAEVVFVGKSLPPHGEGQTPIEAAAAGKAILMGSGMSNFREASRELVAVGGARIATDASQVEGVIETWLRDPELRSAAGSAASKWHRVNQGVLQRTLAVLRAELG